MPLGDVTFAIHDLLVKALNATPGASHKVFVGPPDRSAAEGKLVLFPVRITPNGELRNGERWRRDANGNQRRFEPAVPLDVHYLVTTGSAQKTNIKSSLTFLGLAIRAIEAASPLALPKANQEAVWLSLDPMSIDDLSRIWGLFPNCNCQTSFVFRASPVWIDPLQPLATAGPVGKRELDHGTTPEPF